MRNNIKLGSYKDYIQSLRALSVLIVIFYHLNFDAFSKGYLGVDIFFVISGFVITQRIYKDYTLNKRILIKDFFVRRLKRIFPVLFFVIIIFLIFFIIFGPVGYLLSNIYTSFFSIVGLSNIYFLIKKKNYFDTVFDDPLGHTWSLGVEEQFYVIYPFLLYFLFKIIKFNIEKKIIFILFLSTCILVLLTFNYSKNNPELVFYFPIFRFWEFLIGCLAFFICNNYQIINNKFISFFFLISIIFLLFIGQSKSYISYISINLLVVIFSALLIIFYKQNSFNKFVFENKLIVFIGNISYSLYLWHLPVIYFIELYYGNSVKNILTLPICIILSIFSYHLIENKFRYFKLETKNKFSYKKILLTFCLSFIFLIFISNIGDRKDKLKETIKKIIYKVNYLEIKHNFHARTSFLKTSINGKEIYKYCTSDNKDFKLNDLNLITECLKISDSNNLFFFVEGNSHTANFVTMFDNSDFINNFYYIHKKIQGDTFHDRSFKKVNLLTDKFEKVIYTTNIDNFYQLELLKKNMDSFNKDVLILILGQVPNNISKINSPTKCLIRQDNCIIDTKKDQKDRKLTELKSSLRELALKENVLFFDPYEILCPKLKCNIYDKKKNILKLVDNSHLSKEGSLILVPSFRLFFKKEILK